MGEKIPNDSAAIQILSTWCCGGLLLVSLASVAHANPAKDCLANYKASKFVEAAECFSKLLDLPNQKKSQKAMWLWNTAFVLLDASTASVLFFVQPISGAFLAWLFLGQGLSLTIWIGGALIALGVLLSLGVNAKVKN